MSKPLIAVVGPTGSGKSALAVHLARHSSGEIVNCDSLQLYQGFDIGTAKTPVTERQHIPHHLFDVLSPQNSYSAGDYARAAREVVADISLRGLVPVVVGGTGFYLRALLEGLPVLPERDETLRARLVNREQTRPGNLHRLLRRLDSAAGKRIHVQDLQKTIRALEIRLLTRAALPQPDAARPLVGYRVIKIGLNPDRRDLHERLAGRTREMFREGLLDEVRGLLQEGATGEEKPFESLGYQQALQHLRGELTLEQAIESTLIQTRQYAKRQWTWFRRDPEVIWLDGFGGDPEVRERALTLLADRLN
jgi:tRNA dimethylallyltransferase